MDLRTLPMIHELKILPEYFSEVASGKKSFEIRKNDREFMVGDEVRLMEFVENKGYTGGCVVATITYITNYEQKEGYVVFALDKKELRFYETLTEENK